jgi:acyl carrier protein
LVGGDLDSLDFASLLMAVEDEFGITIDEESVEKVGTLDGLIAFVEDKT